jgi:hypothetical protein
MRGVAAQHQESVRGSEPGPALPVRGSETPIPPLRHSDPPERSTTRRRWSSPVAPSGRRHGPPSAAGGGVRRGAAEARAVLGAARRLRRHEPGPTVQPNGPDPARHAEIGGSGPDERPAGRMRRPQSRGMYRRCGSAWWEGIQSTARYRRERRRQ